MAHVSAATSELNAVVDGQRKEILSLMRSKGYVQKTSRRSAVQLTSFNKEGSSNHFVIAGWHGTGKWGDTKSIWVLDHWEQGTLKHIHSLSLVHSISGMERWTAAQQQEAGSKILEYLSTNA